MNSRTATFDGKTFVSERDGERLTSQLLEVRKVVLAIYPEWCTLKELSEATEYPEASISARLRDMRKARFGGYTVERRYVANGVWEYRCSAGESSAK